jgi:hypothetical protein
LAATYTSGLTAGLRGLAGLVTAPTVTLFASTADGSPNKLVKFVDDGVNAPSAELIATAAMNTIFRGVALSPHAP